MFRVDSVSGIATALAIVFWCASCQHAEDRYLNREVRVEELAGDWSMTPATAKALSESGYTAPVNLSDHRIVLHSDGSCLFSTLPRVLGADGRPERAVKAACSWVLGTVGHQAVLIDLETSPPQHVYYFLSEGPEGELELWQHVGDPDAWQYLEYKRK